VGVAADAQVAYGAQQSLGVHVGANLARVSGGAEQLGARGHQSIEEVGVQRLEAGAV